MLNYDKIILLKTVCSCKYILFMCYEFPLCLSKMSGHYALTSSSSTIFRDGSGLSKFNSSIGRKRAGGCILLSSTRK